MSFSDGEDKREIIIVKRRGGDGEEGHHGGVWKIAFADFMTAMMCFFLVMWLVNASDEETKLAVASYFNPMRLADPMPMPSGKPGSDQPNDALATGNTNTTDKPDGARRDTTGPANHDNSSNLSDTDQRSDQNLFADPYAVLAEIALETATLQNVSAKGDGGAQDSGPATGAQGGEAYRDPFAPDFWSQEMSTPQVEPLETEVAEAQDASEAVVAAVAEALEVAPPQPLEEEAAAPVEEPDDRLSKMAETLRAELTEAFGEDDELNQTISVTASRSGVLISVTDELNYGMFQVGSAVPTGELVAAMGRIGEALAARQGSVSIMGHTDGRPYRGAQYDNWQLSTARAHAAHYMLVRGGLDESRIGEVAGYADRRLKIEGDPLANANRRIEILLDVGA